MKEGNTTKLSIILGTSISSVDTQLLLTALVPSAAETQGWHA
jgi:hypothetical protein